MAGSIGTDLEVEDGEETDREQDGGEERVEHLVMDLTVCWVNTGYWILIASTVHYWVVLFTTV